MTLGMSDRSLEHGNGIVDAESLSSPTAIDDIHVIQAECSNMISLLKSLQKEEHDIQCQLEILAKEALLCGFQNDVVEPPIPKKRTKKLKEKE